MLINVQVRQLAFAIIRSTTIALPAWRRTCKEKSLDPNLIPRDVATRWNSTYDMLRFAVEYREAIDGVTADKSLKLRRFELDNDEWKIIGDLVSVLEVSNLVVDYSASRLTSIKQYKKATLFFSRDTAGIASIIPAMDKLNSGLDPKTNVDYHLAIKSAMPLAKSKLNRYYSLTDGSSAYRIAMGKFSLPCHPSLHL
jgi:hypothetical protein